MEMLDPCYTAAHGLLLSPACNHATVIEQLNRAHELTSQLQALLLPLLPGCSWSELALAQIREMIRCYTSALSRLQSAAGGCWSTPSAVRSVDDRRGSGYSSEEKRKNLDGDWPHNRKRRFPGVDSSLFLSPSSPPPRNIATRKENSCSGVTPVLYDGHQWRKYGQKLIHGSKHPRSYFRCTYSTDQGCQARKTVQKDDSDADPPNYLVVYTMTHTCKNDVETNFPSVTESLVEKSAASYDHRRPTSFVIQEQHHCPPSAAAPNHSQSRSIPSFGDQEMVHLLPSEVTGSVFSGTLDMKDGMLNLESTWESLELDAYMKTMVESLY
ncbi:WRKY transcription factor [Musa troglodytarum]|uniref:WRKY transcription factor n=1 Tax=Musa troglodytarum TaxID=320322 RepID=A0A9E7K4H5_9LILI|nr:WRKY transcription factor [Musa troglodytarum]